MLLKNIMQDRVTTIAPEATLTEASEVMKKKNVGSLPVCHGEEVLGIITDRDIVTRGLSSKSDPSVQKVSIIMSSPVIYCYEDQTIEDAAVVMEEKRIRRLPIFNRERKLTGIVSVSDLARQGHNDRLVGEIFEYVNSRL